MEVVNYRIDAALKSRSGTGMVWLIVALATFLPALFMFAISVGLAFDKTENGGVGTAIFSFLIFVVPLVGIAVPSFFAYQRASTEVGAGRALLELARTDPSITAEDAVRRIAKQRRAVDTFLRNMLRQGWIRDNQAAPVQNALPYPVPGPAIPPTMAHTPLPVNPLPNPYMQHAPMQQAVAHGRDANAAAPVYNAPMQNAPGSPSSTGPAPTPPQGGFGARPVAFVPGTVLGDRWRIEKLLGEGGMGAVFVAIHTRTAKRYALKVILGDGARSEQAVARFEREALTVSGLRHPGIVQVHDYDRAADGSPYLVMDLLDGEPLDSRLERLGSVPFLAARQWVVEAARALAVAHEKGLVHRDIKPGNLFLAQDGGGGERIVVLDFGVVKTADEPKSVSLTRTGAPIGTPMYMAPEQFRGDGVDGRADVWALATVLFQLVAGRAPYAAESMAELTVAVLTQPVPKVASIAQRPVPPGLDAFFARALAKDKNQRFTTFAEFENALLAVA